MADLQADEMAATSSKSVGWSLEGWALERVLVSMALLPADQPQCLQDSEIQEEAKVQPGVQVPGMTWVKDGEEAVRNLNNAAMVCKHWNAVARSKELWQELFDELLKHDRYVPEAIKLQRQSVPRNAYIAALKDSQRTSMTQAELNGFEWSFRFKQMAGPEWIESDPYWQGEDARVGYFLTNGRMKWNPDLAAGTDMEIFWRWGNAQIREPAAGTPTSSVRVTVAGKDVPSYIVSRHPVNNRFLMQSCWALLTSFKMPKIGEDPLMDDDALQVRYEHQSAEALEYNIGSHFGGGGGDLFIEAELQDDRVLLNTGNASFPVPREVAAALVNSGLPGHAVQQLLRMFVGATPAEEEDEDEDSQELGHQTSDDAGESDGPRQQSDATAEEVLAVGEETPQEASATVDNPAAGPLHS